MSKINNTLTNPADLIVGLLLYGYSQQSFLKHVKYKDEDGEQKEMTDKEAYETIVKMVEKGILYVKMLDNDNITLEPELDEKKIRKAPEMAKFHGKFEELKAIQEEVDKLRKEKHEQD